MTESESEKVKAFVFGPASAKWVASLLLAVATGGATLAHQQVAETDRARIESSEWKTRAESCEAARLNRLERLLENQH